MNVRYNIVVGNIITFLTSSSKLLKMRIACTQKMEAINLIPESVYSNC